MTAEGSEGAKNAGAAETAAAAAEPTEKKESTGKRKQKQVIFLTSRVHPGEANASFMVHGAIEFLL